MWLNYISSMYVDETTPSLQLNYEFEQDIATVDLTKIKEQEKWISFKCKNLWF